MPAPGRRFGSVVAAAFLLSSLVGCSTYSKVSEKRPHYRIDPAAVGALASAESEIVEARRYERRDPIKAVGIYIHAARVALTKLESDPENTDALRAYNFAVGRIVDTIRVAKLDPWTSPLAVPYGNTVFHLTHRPDPRPLWNPALYHFTPADQFDIHGTYVDKKVTLPGIGAPTVAIGKEKNKNAAEKLLLPRTYYGVTTVARFEGNRCILAFEDPLATENITVSNRSFPLAADFTVPVAVMLASNDPKKLELTRLLFPEKYAETARIAALQPYDPKKTVVLVIHGLADTQATWTPMINTLRADPEIRRRFQFWFFSYPSGYPYPHSAAILREQLDAALKRRSITKPMIVIGHSMGGCISRLLITDTGEKLWTAIFNRTPAQTPLSPEGKKLFADALIFKHRPEVGRVIFISAPLKGSDLATHWLGRLGSSLVRSPVALLQAGKDLPKLFSFQPGALKLKRIPNSVDTLAPNNRFVKAINTIPITPGIPYHTIIGDRGRKDSPNSSDGVVPYWSSHMPGATSELVVPSGHPAHQNHQAIAEVARIVKLQGN